jgi:hypothetical protein
MSEEPTYEPNIFEVQIGGRILVTASNSRHALERVQTLLKDRITQYVHPEDTPPRYRVIGVVRHLHVVGEPKRRTIVSERTRGEESETESKKTET